MEQPKENSFRDKIATVDKKGKRVWIYPKKPAGAFYRARTIVSIFLLVLFFSGPFIKIHGHPILMLNFLQRTFVVLGTKFWPQDFYLFVLLTISLIVFIVLFTVAFGRLWCGWTCPQTIFMEMVFRKIEYLIEGDASKQRRLNASPMNAEKLIKKTVKHGLFYAISFLIGNTFLAYIIGIEHLEKIISEPPSHHLGGLAAMIIFSGIFYGVFAFMREQVCTLVCPYGRLQGVMLDRNSIVVAYDYKRGEPRGKISKNQNEQRGDCVDCRLCVSVCPTGIDIRNGTQLECVNCTACMDACNSVMTKVKRPKGLIRYASYNSIEQRVPFKLTPRIIGYSSVLTLLVTVFILLLLHRAPIQATVLRTPGVLYQELDNGEIANLYNLKIVNKTYEKKPISLKLKSPQGKVEMVGGKMIVPASEVAETSFFIKLTRDKIYRHNTPVTIDVYSGDELLEQTKTSFLGPMKVKK